jgi:hypothetical protein
VKKEMTEQAKIAREDELKNGEMEVELNKEVEEELEYPLEFNFVKT